MTTTTKARERKRQGTALDIEPPVEVILLFQASFLSPLFSHCSTVTIVETIFIKNMRGSRLVVHGEEEAEVRRAMRDGFFFF